MSGFGIMNNGSGGSGSVGGNVGSGVLYRLGATTDANIGLYGSFAEAITVAQQRRPCTIYFDSSLNTCTIPMGTWDIDNITLSGGSGFTAGIFVEDGALLQGVGIKIDNVTLNQKGSSPFIVLTGSDVLALTLDNGANISCESTPAIHIQDTAFVSCILRYFSYLYGSSSSVIVTDINAQTLIFTDIATALYPNVLDGNGTYLVDDVTGIAPTGHNSAISHVQLAPNITYAFG